MKNILLGVSGSVAVYKAVELTRLFYKESCRVKVVMSPFALNFVSPLQFLSVGAQGCFSEFPKQDNSLQETHITLSEWADCLLIAPATAATIARISIGLADNLLVASFLAMGEKPVYIAPAMNSKMWSSVAVQTNVELLKKRGINIIPPREGMLADGTTGKGPMEDIEKIARLVLNP